MTFRRERVQGTVRDGSTRQEGQGNYTEEMMDLRESRSSISRTKQLISYLGCRSGRSLGGLPCFCLCRLVGDGTNNQDIGV